MNVLVHVRKIVALSEIYGPEPTGRAIEDALEFQAFSCEYVANLLEQRQRRLPEPGALHLTRRQDLLDLELPEPNLALYATDGEPTPTPDPSAGQAGANPASGADHPPVAPDAEGTRPGEPHEPPQGSQDDAG